MSKVKFVLTIFGTKNEPDDEIIVFDTLKEAYDWISFVMNDSMKDYADYVAEDEITTIGNKIVFHWSIEMVEYKPNKIIARD